MSKVKVNMVQKVIRDFYSLSKDTVALNIWDYHTRMQVRNGKPVPGVPTDKQHSLKDTAAFFHISIGRASQYIGMAELIIRERGSHEPMPKA